MEPVTSNKILLKQSIRDFLLAIFNGRQRNLIYGLSNIYK